MSTQPMRLQNTAFFLEKLASDCAPFQYIRELTVNSIQAILARRDRGWTGDGQIHWDVEWKRLEAQPGVFKLQISDNGVGMTGPEMERYINSLASSGREQSFSGNFGVGAKITAGVLNPEGLVYKSWVDGVGALAILHKDTRVNPPIYGLRQLELHNGTFAHHAAVSIELKPEPIDECGTAVTLLGNSETDITMKPIGQPLKWLIKYLNSRFYSLPERIEIKVRDFSKADPSEWPSSPEVGMHEQGSQLRTVKGMKRHLEDHEEVRHGELRLSNATAYWYILPQEPIRQHDIWETSAQIAALYQGELYERRVGRNANARIRDFGILFGYERIVLYIEPDQSIRDLAPNTARSQLVVAGGGLPWDSWAQEFRQSLPQPIKEMMDGIVACAEIRDHREAIRRRLRDIRDLFRLSRYRRNPRGNLSVAGSQTGGNPRVNGGPGGGNSTGGRTGGSGGGAGALYNAYLAVGGETASEIATRVNEPDVTWVSVANGSRAVDDDLEDRAARYDETGNVIYANSDFRVYTDMMQEVGRRYPGVPVDEVKSVVEEWFEQQLVEAVLGARSLRGSPEWDTTSLEQAVSPIALTTAVLPRYSMMRMISRVLGARFGAASSQE